MQKYHTILLLNIIFLKIVKAKQLNLLSHQTFLINSAKVAHRCQNHEVREKLQGGTEETQSFEQGKQDRRNYCH